jgi:hypothetical protein
MGVQELDSWKVFKWVNSRVWSRQIPFLSLGYANQIQNYIYLNPTGGTVVSLGLDSTSTCKPPHFSMDLTLQGSYQFTDNLSGYARFDNTSRRIPGIGNITSFIPSDRMWTEVPLGPGKWLQGDSDLKQHTRHKANTWDNIIAAASAAACYCLKLSAWHWSKGNKLNVRVQVQESLQHLPIKYESIPLFYRRYRSQY